MRIVQLACLLSLALLMNMSSVDARCPGDGPCPSHSCTTCSHPEPAPAGLCKTLGSCGSFGCSFFALCGEEESYAICDCLACPD